MRTLQDFLQRHPDLERIELLFPDINGVLRGKWLPISSVEKLENDGVRLPFSTLALDIWGKDVDEVGLALATGDPDGVARPLLSTLCLLPWGNGKAAQVIMEVVDEAGAPCPYEPRFLLAQIVDRFAKIDLVPVVAVELEFYLFRQRQEGQCVPNLMREASGGHLYNIDTMDSVAPLLEEISLAARAQNIGADVIIAEGGRGQFEINLSHIGDAVGAADRAVSLKRIIKGLAKKHSLEASFMAKPLGDDAGSGMHVHASLINSNGQNIFAGTEDINNPLRHAIGGVLASMAACQSIFAPNLNSFRRFQPASHAPNQVCWGLDNRGAAVRVPEFIGKGARLEHRISGADANPYLVLTAILGGMLIGLTEEIDPGNPMEGAAATGATLYHDGLTAIEAFANSDPARTIFGTDYQQIYAAVRRSEFAEFSSKVSEAEYRAFLGAL